MSENQSYCGRPYQLNLTHLSAQRNRKRNALAKAANERSPVTESGGVTRFVTSVTLWSIMSDDEMNIDEGMSVLDSAYHLPNQSDSRSRRCSPEERKRVPKFRQAILEVLRLTS